MGAIGAEREDKHFSRNTENGRSPSLSEPRAQSRTAGLFSSPRTEQCFSCLKVGDAGHHEMLDSINLQLVRTIPNFWRKDM
jgi:hypothetical protein